VIHEGTLRKIEHASGAPVFTPSDKVEIARLLEAVGVEEIGANPGQYSETIKRNSELEGVEAVCRAGLKLKVRVSDHDFRWLRGDSSYIDKSAELWIVWRRPADRESDLAKGLISEDAARHVYQTPG
jgi:hypothetical protein